MQKQISVPLPKPRNPTKQKRATIKHKDKRKTNPKHKGKHND